jgi:hypothetical protein
MRYLKPIQIIKRISKGEPWGERTRSSQEPVQLVRGSVSSRSRRLDPGFTKPGVGTLVPMLTLSLSALLAGCLSGPGGGAAGGSGDGVSVSLNLQTESLAKRGASQSLAALRPVDSAQVRISGTAMDTLAFGFRVNSGAQSLSMIDIPPGPNRRFEVSLFHAGKTFYKGAVTAELRTDRANSITVNCLPEFSRISASIHIPIDFPLEVAGGILRVENDEEVFSAAPTINGELRNFRLEEVPGDREYSVSLALWGPGGDTLATAYRAGVYIPKGQNVALVMPLALAFTQIALTMTVGEPTTTSIVMTLPGGRRTPTMFGEAIISEIYAIPTAEEGSDNGEWLELFNRITDTLDLSGCQLIRDAGTGTGMSFTLPSNTLIAPGRGLIVGRSAVSFAHVVQASALTLTNTSARLEFACTPVGGATARIDTMRYSTSLSDTVAARIIAAKVTTLKPSRLASRHKSDAWCLSSVSPSSADYGMTPGGIIGSCGE